MKIYFAGSIAGGRDDAPIYQSLIEELKKYGEVLTEHIADQSMSGNGENLPPETVYTRDVDWVKESDVLVAEVTQTSLGVGYELGLAHSLNIPILCLFRQSSGKRLSAMISGNAYNAVRFYDSTDELPAIIEAWFKNLDR